MAWDKDRFAIYSPCVTGESIEEKWGIIITRVWWLFSNLKLVLTLGELGLKPMANDGVEDNLLFCSLEAFLGLSTFLFPSIPLAWLSLILTDSFPPIFDRCPDSSYEICCGICRYDFVFVFVFDNGVDKVIINLGIDGQEFSRQLGVVNQEFNSTSIKWVHDDNNLTFEFKIGHKRKQMNMSILTEVVETFAKFQFQDPFGWDFRNASINKRLSKMIDLLKVLNVNAFCSYPNAIVQVQLIKFGPRKMHIRW